MALRGTLKDFALPDIFQLIGMQRKTGLLTLESERETVTVVFENGMVVMADSSVRRLDDLLGTVLVRNGKLKKTDLEEALNKQRDSMQRLGYILTSQGYIETEALKEALAEQVQQIVFRVFRWKDGQYDFDPAATVDYDRRNVNPVSTDHILMEGIRRVDEWPIIEKRIPSMRMVFRPLVPKNQIQVSEEGQGSVGLEAAFEGLDSDGGAQQKSQSDGVVLSETESKIYNLLDGRQSVSALMETTGLSDFDVSRTLFDLIERNLVEPVGHQKDQAARPDRRAAASASPALGIAVLVIVLAATLVGLIMSYSTPFRVPGASELLPTTLALHRQAATQARLERLESAIKIFFLTFGQYPGSLEDLVNSSPALVAPDDLRDSKGVPIVYDRSPGRIALTAVNEAGEPYLVFVHEIPPEFDTGMELVDPS